MGTTACIFSLNAVGKSVVEKNVNQIHNRVLPWEVKEIKSKYPEVSFVNIHILTSSNIYGIVLYKRIITGWSTQSINHDHPLELVLFANRMSWWPERCGLRNKWFNIPNSLSCYRTSCSRHMQGSDSKVNATVRWPNAMCLVWTLYQCCQRRKTGSLFHNVWPTSFSPLLWSVPIITVSAWLSCRITYYSGERHEN